MLAIFEWEPFSSLFIYHLVNLPFVFCLLSPIDEDLGIFNLKTRSI